MGRSLQIINELVPRLGDPVSARSWLTRLARAAAASGGVEHSMAHATDAQRGARRRGVPRARRSWPRVVALLVGRHVRLEAAPPSAMRPCERSQARLVARAGQIRGV